MKPSDYHQIEKYIHNELDANEAAAFEERMRRDPGFAETVTTYRALGESLQAREDRKKGEQELRGNLTKISDEYFSSSPKPKTKIIHWQPFYWAAAACIIIGVSIIFFISRDSPSTLFDEYAVYSPIALADRGSEDSLEFEAEQAFNSGNYPEAAALLQQLVENNPNNTAAKLYQAIALMEINQHEKADALLARIQSSGSVLQTRATWYKALNFLKQKMIDESKEELQKIPEGTPEYAKAQELLDEI